jgi:hypothetical protein
MDDINAFIKEVWIKYMDAGLWGMPSCGDDCAHCADVCDVQSKKNTFVAKTYDRISAAMVNAMRAHSKGLIANASHKGSWLDKWFGDRFLAGEYGMLINGYFESYLSIAAINTMCLLRYYACVVHISDVDGMDSDISHINTARFINRDAIENSLDVGLYGCHSRAKPRTKTMLLRMMRMADMDGIDIKRHVLLRIKYEMAGGL